MTDKTVPLTVAYATFKQLIGLIPAYYVLQGDNSYMLYASGESAFVQAWIPKTDAASIADFETNYKSKCATAASADDAYVLGLIANKIPLVEKRLPDGRMRVSQEKSTASRITFYTHNWCDPTTWYTCSKSVSEVVTFSSGSYKLSYGNVIDVYHGKLTGEDFIKHPGTNASLRVSVIASGHTLVEQDPHYGAGGDYTVDYENGLILPVSGTAFADPVTASYHHATNSAFYLTPLPGKTLVITEAEVNFSVDIGVTDTISFQAQGLVDDWAPQLVAAHLVPSGTYINLGNPVRYKTMMDYMNESQRAYPSYPPLGGNSWRAIQSPTVVLDWDYVAAQSITSSPAMRVQLKLDHDIPFSGTVGTATFYCTSEDA